MKVAELREMSLEELMQLKTDASFEMAKHKFDMATRKLDSVAKIKATRKKIARILTLITQKKNQQVK